MVLHEALGGRSHIYIYIYIHICLLITNIYIYIYIHTYTCIHYIAVLHEALGGWQVLARGRGLRGDVLVRLGVPVIGTPLHICMYACMYVYIYIYIYMYIYIYTPIYIYLYQYLFLSLSIYIYIHNVVEQSLQQPTFQNFTSDTTNKYTCG